MKRHKWKDNKCVTCGLERKRKSWKLRMAIVGSRDYYQYGTDMAYRVKGEWTFDRPECTHDESATNATRSTNETSTQQTNP